jgi:hypothetical protein
VHKVTCENTGKFYGLINQRPSEQRRSSRRRCVDGCGG